MQMHGQRGSATKPLLATPLGHAGGRVAVPLGIVALAVLCLARDARAQGYAGYQQYPLSPELADRSEQAKLKGRKNDVLKQASWSSEAEDIVNRYYKGFLFPAMTREEFADQLPKLRVEFLRDVLNAGNLDARKSLLAKAYALGRHIAMNPKAHPAARVNAVLLLGELNQVEGDGVNRAPIPLKPLTLLLATWASEEGQHEAVRAAAMAQLVRHTRLRAAAKDASRLDDKERADLTQLALRFLQAKDLPSERSPAAHDWYRRQALEMLGALGSPGANGEVVDTLLAIVVDKSADVEVRSSAVQALARLKLGDNPPDSGKLGQGTARLIVDLLEAELDALEGRSDFGMMTSGDGGRRGDGGRLTIPGQMTEEPESRRFSLTDPNTATTRRRLLASLPAIQAAIAGTRGGATGLVEFLDSDAARLLTVALNDTLTAAKDPKLTMPALMVTIESTVDLLKEQLLDEEPRNGRGRRRGGMRDRAELSPLLWTPA